MNNSDSIPLIIGTGLKGLVGSKLVDDLQGNYVFKNLDVSHPEEPVDITNIESIRQACQGLNSRFLIHCAAYTNVSEAWNQRNDRTGSAYQVNVVGTQNIVKVCQENNIHLIHLSTAYIFNGDNDGLYLESDPLSPIEWYGQTKAWAEESIVNSQNLKWTILRIDQPFRSDSFARQDIAHRIISGLKTGSLYPQFTNHYLGPTFIDDLVKVIDWVIRTGQTGLYHASSGEKWSDFEFAELINNSHALGGVVQAGDLDDYLKTLQRPYQRNTALDTSKLFSELDFTPLSVSEAVKRIKI